MQMTNLVNIMFLEMSLAELAQTELVERLLEGQHFCRIGFPALHLIKSYLNTVQMTNH